MDTSRESASRSRDWIFPVSQHHGVGTGYFPCVDITASMRRLFAGYGCPPVAGFGTTLCQSAFTALYNTYAWGGLKTFIGIYLPAGYCSVTYARLDFSTFYNGIMGHNMIMMGHNMVMMENSYLKREFGGCPYMLTTGAGGSSANRYSGASRIAACCSGRWPFRLRSAAVPEPSWLRSTSGGWPFWHRSAGGLKPSWCWSASACSGGWPFRPLCCRIVRAAIQPGSLSIPPVCIYRGASAPARVAVRKGTKRRLLYYTTQERIAGYYTFRRDMDAHLSTLSKDDQYRLLPPHD
ncbi:hypothetical protein DAPPUDRAFT_111186 [Daphnia pulex]|uniref:Uncharacterized protein n=1 Tax=Daphnia pulex TaxID=6669 RepID=E9H8G6_DAPPU|nr:hypothetical protein DAPPUDRAFT_111186 [Daphnia pulex]|eukprot:EFX71943.1 hypothetical protein DAPPUDRAFT_111186 [Daphnia pulex]